MKRITVFIDESGTLPDPKDKIIVVAAVVAKNPLRIDEIMKRLKKKGVQKRIGELKFYTAGDKTKMAFFEMFAQEEFDVFVLIIEKMRRKIPDTPRHFALLCWLLLTDVLSFHSVTDIVFDRHFFKKTDQKTFNEFLAEFLNIEFALTHVDSKKHKRVNVSDMVAGAVLAKETGKDKRFYFMIENRIVSFKKINWVEAKKRLFS